MMRWYASLAAIALLAACTQLSPQDIVFEDAARQQQLRNIQTHTFPVSDRIKTLRAIIVTLQDLNFVIDQADSRLGFISATKLNGYRLNISVLVDDTDVDGMMVRAGFSAALQPVHDDSYREFFASLQKNLVQ
jgi:hypothetical protein